MTAQQPPVWISGESHEAEDLRRAMGTIMGPGIVTADDMAVTEKSGTPNMSVDVAGGRAWILGSDATYQGIYVVDNRGVRNVTLATADGSNPRKDLIVARVRDSVYAGITDDWDIVAVTGTPAASPTEPTAPETSITLAMVDVAASASSVTNSNITDRRSLARPWGAAWGFLGRVESTANQVLSTSWASMGPGSRIDGLAIPSGRRHRVHFRCRHESSASNAVVMVVDDGVLGSNLTAESFLPHVRATQTHSQSWDLSGFTGDTVRAVVKTSGGAGRLRGDQEPTVLSIEDIGPA